MYIICGDVGGGSAWKSSDRLRWPAIFPPTEVDFCPGHHLKSRRGLPPGRGGEPTLVITIYLPRRDNQCPGNRCHLHPGETVRTSAPRYQYLHLRALDSLVPSHGPSSIRTPRLDRVLDRGQCPDTQVGLWRDPEPQRAQQKSGVGGDLGDATRHSCLSTVPWHKYRRLAVSTNLHSQWDRDGVPGMAQSPIATMRH